MKRNLLALAIPALLVAGAANASIEIYNKDGNKLSINGQAEVVNYLGDHTKTKKEGDDSSARFGFTGETQITDSITGYGKAEWNVAVNSGSDTKNNVETRYAFAGLDFGAAGAVDYGHNDGVLKAITTYTDVLPKFGGDASSDDYLLSQRQDAVLTYRNAKLVDGLSFAIQYADNASVNNKAQRGKEAYGLNAQYAIADTGVTIGAGYAQTAKVSGEKDTAYMFGVNYDANDLYLAAIYANDTEKHSANNKTKTKGFEAVAQYGIALDVGTVKPSLAYVQHTEKTGSTKNKLAKYVSVGATYDFNKNLSFAADYKINLLKKDDNSADYKNTLGLGLTYQF